MPYLKVMIASLALLALIFGTVLAFGAEPATVVGPTTIQKGAPPEVKATSYVPPNTVGGAILTLCGKTIAIEYFTSEPEHVNALIYSAADFKNFAAALEEAKFYQKAGGPVHTVELSKNCQES